LAEPGFPPPDQPVVKYFATIPKDNEFSNSAHAKIAFFLAAAHLTMLDRLQSAQRERNLNGPELLSHWHEQMESKVSDYRSKFFQEVVSRIREVSPFFSLFPIFNHFIR
jgi:hypothetical protein